MMKQPEQNDSRENPSVSGRKVAAHEAADEVAPASKLAFAFRFGSFLILAAKLGSIHATVVSMALGAATMLLVVALLPQKWSRGFSTGFGPVDKAHRST